MAASKSRIEETTAVRECSFLRYYRIARFGSAYMAIRMLADVGLHAHGHRTLTSRPGHHQTALQTLPLTLGLEPRAIVRLDAPRKQRNLNEYTGDVVPEATVAECLTQAEALLAIANSSLKAHKPELL